MLHYSKDFEARLHRGKSMLDSDFVSSRRNDMRDQLKGCELRLKCLLRRTRQVGRLYLERSKLLGGLIINIELTST